MSNRHQRRHPQHPALPTQYPSKKRIVDKEKKKTSEKKKDKQPKGKPKVI